MNENFLRVMIIVQIILKCPDKKWKKEHRINGSTKENDGIALWMHSWGIRLKLVFWEDGHPFPECCIYAKSVTIIHSYFCNRYVQICITKDGSWSIRLYQHFPWLTGRVWGSIFITQYFVEFDSYFPKGEYFH